MTEPSTTAGPASHASPAAERGLKTTRTSGLWIAVISFVLLLLLLSIFLLQNGQRVQISYLGAGGRIPLAVAMLLSSVAGGLLVATAGVGRVMQLRHTARRRRKVRQS